MPIKKRNVVVNKSASALPAEKKCSKSCYHFFEGLMYLVLVLIIILAGIKLWLITKQFNNIINDDTYQIVTLDNGESYFGRIENVGFKYFKLSDVYYVKYSEAETNSTEGEEQTTPNYELKLIPLGQNEFYKPETTMMLNRDNIVHWENLQKDSQVMEYILAQ